MRIAIVEAIHFTYECGAASLSEWSGWRRSPGREQAAILKFKQRRTVLQCTAQTPNDIT
jgi:hypothetical protein